MANGTIAFDTLQTSGQITGTAKSVDTDYVVNGSAKVWSNVDNTGTIGVSDSLNVSTATDEATGQYKLTYTNNMSNSSYAWSGSHSDSGSAMAAIGNTGSNSGTLASTSGISIAAEDVDAGFTDYDANTLMIMGNLA